MLDKTSHAERLHGRGRAATSAARTSSRPARSPTAPSGSGSAGLFKDTFLTCQVQAPAKADDQALAERADAWCVQVANATNIAR